MVTRGKDRGKFYLKVVDDGEGIPLNEEGNPDFKYVATHICDSVKRQLKKDGVSGIQGEFGIGLLSFWTVGEELTVTSTSEDGRLHQMRMRKGVPEYEVSTRRTLAPIPGTELRVYPLLAGIRQLTGDRIQRYLAAELRDRIRNSGVQIRVVDRTARAEYDVEPREFSGQLLHDLSAGDVAEGEIYLELYLNEASDEHRVSLCRQGTRVLREALLALPEEDYDWFDVYGIRAGVGKGDKKGTPGRPLAVPDRGDGRHPTGEEGDIEVPDDDGVTGPRDFFEFPGPLHSVVISPRSCVVPVGQKRRLRGALLIRHGFGPFCAGRCAL